MPTRPNVQTLSATSVDILNAIRTMQVRIIVITFLLQMTVLRVFALLVLL